MPLFELYDNVQRYGPIISAIPQMLSRFKLNFAGERDEVSRPLSQPGPSGEEKSGQKAKQSPARDQAA